MERFIVLLRGINIGGKNRIVMSELRDLFEDLGFSEVKTLLNSGNVAFSSAETDSAVLTGNIRNKIEERFGLELPVLVMKQTELRKYLSAAPEWWGTGTPEWYDNLIFVLPPDDAHMISEKLGVPSENLEKVQICENTFFWSFDRKKYAKANWWKRTAAPGIGERLTIRTANTLRKLAEL